MTMQTFIDQIQLWTPKLGAAAVVFLIFWLLAGMARAAVLKFSQRARVQEPIASLLARSTKLVLIFFGMVTALGTLGIDITALVAGLGLTGFALGFALKDTISNLLAGVLLMIYRPFDINDRVQIGGHEGRVNTIDLRYTTLMDEDKKILIPNSMIFTNTVTVLGNSPSQE